MISDAEIALLLQMGAGQASPATDLTNYVLVGARRLCAIIAPFILRTSRPAANSCALSVAAIGFDSQPTVFPVDLQVDRCTIAVRSNPQTSTRIPHHIGSLSRLQSFLHRTSQRWRGRLMGAGGHPASRLFLREQRFRFTQQALRQLDRLGDDPSQKSARCGYRHAD
jgi:hypothetical protein